MPVMTHGKSLHANHSTKSDHVAGGVLPSHANHGTKSLHVAGGDLPSHASHGTQGLPVAGGCLPRSGHIHKSACE